MMTSSEMQKKRLVRMSNIWDRVSPYDREIVEPFLQEVPVRVGALADALGIKVVRSPLSPNISGLIKPSPETRAGFEIRVNKYEVPERQRFTVAHELGHYLLHRHDIGAGGVVDSVMYRSALTSRKEAEANRIAADIVMPLHLVRREVDRCGGLVRPEIADLVANRFKVSLPAMKVRLGLG